MCFLSMCVCACTNWAFQKVAFIAMSFGENSGSEPGSFKCTVNKLMKNNQTYYKYILYKFLLVNEHINLFSSF